MTTSVSVTACSNPRTQVTVEIRDHVGDRDDVVQEIKLPPGGSGSYHATTSRSIAIKETAVAEADAA